MTAAGPFIRIALRYLAGFLVAKGLLDQETGNTLATDPDVIAAVGAGIGLLVEMYYGWARKKGKPL